MSYMAHVVSITYQVETLVMPFAKSWRFEFAVWSFGLKQSLHPVQRNVRQQGRDYSSYNVAKKVLELSLKVEIPRSKFQPNYGSGFKGAPLQP
jgi:hypothetical protein